MSSAADAIVHGDLNMAAAALLYDMAALQPTERSQFGYKRAAKAIIGLPVSVADLVAAGTLARVEFVGPSSARIITEWCSRGVRHRRSGDCQIDEAVAGDVEARSIAGRYLSHFAMQQALAAPLGTGIVRRAEYRGDFQMHSTWSDGGESIAGMVAGLHGPRTYVPWHHRSLVWTADRARHQHDRRGRAAPGNRSGSTRSCAGRFRVFKGIEANILADGSLDLQPSERSQFEFVVASPHSQLRRADDQTARMLAAVMGAGVTILGHPRGRVFNSAARRRRRLASCLRSGSKTAGRDRARRQLASSGHRLRAGARRTRRRVHICARQRRAFDRRASIQRLRDRARAARGHSSLARDQLLER